jgi:hypothetical protein
MNAAPTVEIQSPKPKSIVLSIRQRALLHRLLHRDLRKCSAVALESFKRHGWTSGLGGAYQLTEKGRQIAELSEQMELGRAIELQLPERSAGQPC